MHPWFSIFQYLPDIWQPNIFLFSVDCPFTLLIVSFGAQSFLIVINSNLSNFSFTTHAFDDSAGKESACKVGHLSSIPGLGSSSPGEGKGYPLRYSGLENSVDCIVHGVTKRRTQLSGFHCHFRYICIWLYRPLSEKWCLCFLILYLGIRHCVCVCVCVCVRARQGLFLKPQFGY